MARNVVMAHHLQHGQAWTFVHSSGKRTEYAYDRQLVPAYADPEGKHPGKDAMHALLNPKTGKEALVSERWLREGPVGDHSYWLLGAASEVAEAA